MPTLRELFALDETITIAGVEYHLTQLRGRDQGMIDERIKRGRRDPAAAVRELASLMTPDERKHYFDQVIDQAWCTQEPTVRERAEFQETFVGMAFCFWLSLRRHHPDVTEDEAADLLSEFGIESMQEMIDKVKARYPDATDEQILEAAGGVETGAMKEIIDRMSGLPVGNGPPPADEPGT